MTRKQNPTDTESMELKLHAERHGGGGGGGAHCAPLSDFLSVYFNRWSYEADFLWFFLKFYTGNVGGKFFFIGQKIWPHRQIPVFLEIWKVKKIGN